MTAINMNIIFADNRNETHMQLTENDKIAKIKEWTKAVPRDYLENCNNKGKIVDISYDTYDYTNNQKITKVAKVYLPYGYDENDTVKRYNVLYMMHGWTQTSDDFFNGNDKILNLFDNMIDNNIIPPFVAVSLTFDRDNRSQSFSRSVAELSVFHKEFKNEVMPYIESNFNTYANGDISEENLKQTRNHRAFTGFSLGAVTTWYQIYHNMDYIKYFAPLSGDCWIKGTYGGLYYPEETVDAIIDKIDESKYKNDFYIYEGIGTNDPIFDQTDSQIKEMIKREEFNENNLKYGIKQNGRHDLIAVREYLYNFLLKGIF